MHRTAPQNSAPAGRQALRAGFLTGDGPRPLLLDNLALPTDLKVAILAPHPDDFDAIAVTLRRLHQKGNRLELVVLTSGDSGVEDVYAVARAPLSKGEIREREQRASCRFFGLADDRVRFLRLATDDQGSMKDNSENYAALRDALLALRPDLVCMPHGNDTNADHQRACLMFRRIVQQDRLSLVALFNRDPKTIALRHDLLTVFSNETAEWKKELLRFHDSQHQRNLRTRGFGFDDRVLQTNVRIAEELGQGPFVEAFEIESFHS